MRKTQQLATDITSCTAPQVKISFNFQPEVLMKEKQTLQFDSKKLEDCRWYILKSPRDLSWIHADAGHVYSSGQAHGLVRTMVQQCNMHPLVRRLFEQKERNLAKSTLSEQHLICFDLKSKEEINGIQW